MTRDGSWEFINGLLIDATEDRCFPGAVLTIVENGAVTFSRGYGYSDMEAESTVDPAETGFRISSVSGLFTAMAILKLAEDSQVRLEDEAIEYVPELGAALNQEEPLRLMNLINHSDGLQECLLDTASLQLDNRISLKTLVSKHAAPAVCEPGESITFGKMSMAIAGRVIEIVSGVTYSEYIKKQILEPLGMHNTFIFPDKGMKHVETAASYGFNNGVLTRLPEIFSNIPPADGIMSTGTDMGLLLAFLLKDDTSNGKGVLGSRSLDKIASSGLSPVAGLPGVTCGFFECPVEGGTVLIRKGEEPGSSCIICILPGEGTGFFLAANKQNGKIQDELTQRVIDNLRKETPFRRESKQAGNSDRGLYSGNYHYVQHGRNTIARYMSLSSGLLRVEPDSENEDGLKIIPLGQGDSLGGFEQTEIWNRLEGDLFKGRDGRLVAFKRNDKGVPDELCSAQGFHGCYKRVRWYDSADYYSALAGLFLMVFLLCAVASPVLIFTGTGYSVLLALLLGTSSLLNFLFLISIQSSVQSAGSINSLSSLYFSDGHNPFLKLLLAFPLVTAAMTIALVIFTAVSWSSLPLSTSLRVIYPLFSFISLTFIIFLNRVKLLGYRY